MSETMARQESAMFGGGATLKETAVEYILAETADCAVKPYKAYMTRSLSDTPGPASPDAGGLLDQVINTTTASQ